MPIDKNGRLFSKVSIIDLIIVLVVIALAVGLVLKKSSPVTKKIVSSNTKFYVTFMADGIRQFSVDAIKEGDVFYEATTKLGSVVKLRKEQAYSIMHKTDGTAIDAPLEDRYCLYITLECTGNVTSGGYFINGSRQVAAGGDLRMQSNMIRANVRIFDVSDSLE